MKKILLSIVVGLAGLLVTSCGSSEGEFARSRPGLVPATTTEPLAGKGDPLLAMVNKVRAKKGLKALRMDSKLNKCAQLHSEDQAKMGAQGHKGSDGSSVRTRVKRVDPFARAWGENVMKADSDVAVVSWWTSSPKHYGNMVSRKFSRAGVSRYQGYRTMVFAN